MKISLIAAVAENGVIGRGGQLPWRLSSDLRRFKRLTLGHHLIVGRKTFESIGRPLPGRKMIVVSRDPFLALPPDVLRAATPEAALALAEAAGEEEAFVAGGGEIYRVLLPRADRLYLTEVAGDFEGDAFFPTWPRNEWRQSSCEAGSEEAAGGPAWRFVVYERDTARAD